MRRPSFPEGPAPASGRPFSGFPDSGLATTVPSLFFSRVLPEIETVAELVVTAYFFFAQSFPGRTSAGARRTPRFLTRRELEADATLMRSLANLCGGEDGGALPRGLDLAVRRGTLFRATVKAQEREEELFAVNTPANRRAMGALETAGLRVEEPLPPAEASARANIFALYEENIGNITPLIAEDLKEAESRYPPEWVREAMREAVELNKRNWRYVERILRRWETEGPDYEKPERDTEAEWLERRYRAGKRRRPAPGLTA